MAKRSASSVRAGRAAKSGRATSRRIDYGDIPPLSDAQLRSMRRIGRPPLGKAARQLIAIRLDPDVLDALRTEAERKGIGYQTLIHQLLEAHVRSQVA